MLAVSLFFAAIIFTLGHSIYKKEWDKPALYETFLSYILFFNMGLMGFLAAYAHIFMGPQTAELIGWSAGSPFQFEVGMANLSYGVLGLMAFTMRGRFWTASCIGWSVLLLGCFVGHILNFLQNDNTAPYNIGIYIWFNDLFLPLLVLSLLRYIPTSKTESEGS